MPQPDKNFWTEFAKSHEDAWCAALSRLIQYDTVSGNPEPRAHAYWRGRIAEGFGYLHALAREHGLVTRYYPDRVLVIEMPGPKNAPVLGFPIHLDVVPAGEGWTRRPFGGEIAEGAIWGRGAQDDKGPIIQVLFALLAAMRWAKESNKGFQKTIRIMIFSEEEVGQWDDIPFYFEREAPPDFSIVPDADFPITNGEKGFVNIGLKFAWPADLGKGFEIRAGERANVVPALATLRVPEGISGGASDGALLDAIHPNAPKKPETRRENGELVVEFHGVGAHGSLPHKGHNAATDALAYASRLPGLAGHPASQVFAWLSRAAASLDGSFLNIAHRHEKVGSTTVNLGVLSVNGTGGSAILNIRNPIGLPCAEVGSRVNRLVQELKMEAGLSEATAIPDREGREPIYVDADRFADWIVPMRRAYETTTGREATLQTIGGTTFAKAFPNAVCFGPVDINEETELAHQADERVTLAAMRRNIEIYGRTIIELAL